MNSSEGSFDDALRMIRQLTDDCLADVEKRMSVLEADRLPGLLPLLPMTKDTTQQGCERQRMELLKLRIDRLEREVNLYSLRAKR